MTPKVKRLIAEILSGISVPRSMGVLGMAAKPRDELVEHLGLRGYFNSKDAEKAINDHEEEYG